MRILFFLAALFVCLPGYAGEAACGISLGIRDNAWVDAGRRKDWPMAFRIRNLQATPISGSALPACFPKARCISLPHRKNGPHRSARAGAR